MVIQPCTAWFVYKANMNVNSRPICSVFTDRGGNFEEGPYFW